MNGDVQNPRGIDIAPPPKKKLLPPPLPLASQELPSYSDVLHAPTRTLERGVSLLSTSPLAGGAEIINAVAQAVSQPFSLADLALRKSGFGMTADWLSSPFKGASIAVEKATSAINQGLRSVGVPENVMNLGLSRNKAEETSRAIGDINKTIAQFATGGLLHSAYKDVVPTNRPALLSTEGMPVERRGLLNLPEEVKPSSDAVVRTPEVAKPPAIESNKIAAQRLYSQGKSVNDIATFLGMKPDDVRSVVGSGLPEFRMTEDAIQFGQKNPKSVDALSQRRQESLARVKDLVAQGNTDAALKMAVRAQFDREAIEAAQGSPIPKEIQRSLAKPEKPLSELGKPSEEQKAIEARKPLSEASLDKLPDEMTKAVKEKAQSMLGEMQRSFRQGLSPVRRAGIEDPFEGGQVVGYTKGGEVNTFPDWFRYLGRNKEDVMKNLQKIIDDDPQNQLARELKTIIEKHLEEGYQAPEGFEPPHDAFVEAKNKAMPEVAGAEESFGEKSQGQVSPMGEGEITVYRGENQSGQQRNYFGKTVSLDEVVPNDLMHIFDRSSLEQIGIELPEKFYRGWDGITLGKLLDGFEKLGIAEDVIRESARKLRKAGYSRIGNVEITDEGARFPGEQVVPPKQTSKLLPPKEEVTKEQNHVSPVNEGTATENTWYHGEGMSPAEGPDKFFSASQDVADNFGNVTQMKPEEMPKNPLTVNSKEELADKIGYKGDPRAEAVGTKSNFDDMAKAYAQKQGHDAIIYENGMFDQPEMHVFGKETPSKSPEQQYVEQKVKEGNAEPARQQQEEIRRQKAEQLRVKQTSELSDLVKQQHQIRVEIEHGHDTPEDAAKAQKKLDAVNKRIGKLRDKIGNDDLFNEFMQKSLLGISASMPFVPFPPKRDEVSRIPAVRVPIQ